MAKLCDIAPRVIPGFTAYTVCVDGTVWCGDKEVTRHDNARGYLKVFLRRDEDGKRVSKPVHRLVAEAFILNPAGLPVVNHIDGDKYNNAVSNLEWVSYCENTRKFFQSGTQETRPVARVNKNGNIANVFLSIKQAADFFQCDYRGLNEAIKANRKYKGYRWAFCRLDITLDGGA